MKRVDENEAALQEDGWMNWRPRRKSLPYVPCAQASLTQLAWAIVKRKNSPIAKPNATAAPSMIINAPCISMENSIHKYDPRLRNDELYNEIENVASSVGISNGHTPGPLKQG